MSAAPSASARPPASANSGRPRRVAGLQPQRGRRLAPVARQPREHLLYGAGGPPRVHGALFRRQQGEQRLDDERVLEGVPVRCLLVGGDDLGGQLGTVERRVLGLCDGTRAARDIQAELGTDVPAILETLIKRRWIVWHLDVPVGTYPERRLRELIDRIGQPAIRERALDKLRVLERGRGVAAARLAR